MIAESFGFVKWAPLSYSSLLPWCFIVWLLRKMRRPHARNWPKRNQNNCERNKGQNPKMNNWNALVLALAKLLGMLCPKRPVNRPGKQKWTHTHTYILSCSWLFLISSYPTFFMHCVSFNLHHLRKPTWPPPEDDWDLESTCTCPSSAGPHAIGVFGLQVKHGHEHESWYGWILCWLYGSVLGYA